MKKVLIIAEAGVNHNGSLKTAKALVDAVCRAGADAVKFQTFKADALVTAVAPKAEYQKRTTSKHESHLEMIRKLELNDDAHRELIKHCQKRGIMFLSSPFDMESIDLLRRLKLNTFKIPSGEITNLLYLEKIGSLNKKVILSTGMADLNDIKTALKILVRAGTPKSKIVVLHCTTQYPTPAVDVHLRAMATIAKDCGVAVGYSDHTMGIEVAIAAVALGAEVIEKHLTLDRTMNGPDHKASLEPDEFKAMVSAIRNIESALGSPVKKPSKDELKIRTVARKSLTAKRPITKGEILSVDNVTAKRPGSGLSPMVWLKVKGQKAKRNFTQDELIEL